MVVYFPPFCDNFDQFDWQGCKILCRTIGQETHLLFCLTFAAKMIWKMDLDSVEFLFKGRGDASRHVILFFLRSFTWIQSNGIKFYKSMFKWIVLFHNRGYCIDPSTYSRKKKIEIFASKVEQAGRYILHTSHWPEACVHAQCAHGCISIFQVTNVDSPRPYSMTAVLITLYDYFAILVKKSNDPCINFLNFMHSTALTMAR